MFLFLALLLLLILPSPWNVVGAVAGGVLFALEIGYWQRRVRREKVRTGVENIIGATGEVTQALMPTGQVRVLSELWEARSSKDVPRGSRVRVVAVRGLTLDVETVEDPQAGPTVRSPSDAP